MALSDVSEVDAAIMTRLANDPTLKGLLPDGVFYDVAAPGSQNFLIVARLDGGAENIFERKTGWETYVYLVKAVCFGTSGANVKSAAKRIHEMMQHASINAVGYADMRCQRIEPIRYTEVDEVSDARWQHRGGQYEVWLIPAEG